jgi:hypothetical protein
MRFINSPSCILDIISVLNNIDASKRSFNSKNNIITTCKDEVTVVNKQKSFYNNELSCTTLRSYTRKILELSELFISLLHSNSDNDYNNSNNNNKLMMTKKKKNITTITASNTIKNATYILNLKETNDNNYLFKQLFITQIGADSDIKLNLLTKAQHITALHKIKIDIILQLLILADDQIKFHNNNIRSSCSSYSSNDAARDDSNVVVHFTDASDTDECINKSKDNIKKKRKICDLNKHDDMNVCIENDRDKDDGYQNNHSGSSLHSIGDDDYDDDDSGSSLHSIEDDSDDDGYNVHTSAKMISISGDVYIYSIYFP